MTERHIDIRSMLRLSILILALAVGSTQMASAQTAPDSTRPLKNMMFTLGQDMNRINDGLWHEDYGMIRAGAQGIADHPRVPPEQMAAIKQALGEKTPLYLAARHSYRGDDRARMRNDVAGGQRLPQRIERKSVGSHALRVQAHVHDAVDPVAVTVAETETGQKLGVATDLVGASFVDLDDSLVLRHVPSLVALGEDPAGRSGRRNRDGSTTASSPER